MRTRTHFCFENRPPTWESRRRRDLFEMQGRDVVLRLSDHVILWISLFRERTPSRHVSGKSPVSDGKALSPYLFHHFSLRSSCASKHGFAIRGGGTSCVHMLQRICGRFIWFRWTDKKVSWHATQVPCVRLRARIAAKPSK